MGLPPLSKIPFILRPQAWLHRRHYGEVLSPIRWWGADPVYLLFGVNVCWVAGAQTLTARSGSAIACQRAHCANVPV
ncbi:carboxymuconolactone decarboxylase family protein [Shigella flexneri]|uniref:Putative decarboxylase n=1 Tax=Escherichia coli TaxID=562 RepID=A0A376KUZ0_ECOLX|nr:putative decarboxylase [Escherichia coli]SVI04971.1 carboxymuconolactone decarboxylase family protein [Shigella flexneri]